MNALAHYYAAAASAFREIFYHKLPENFSRNHSGKAPLFFRKFPEKFRRKFPEISELTTLALSNTPQSGVYNYARGRYFALGSYF